MKISVVPGTFAIVKLPADSSVPAWVQNSSLFSSITRTPEELSIVCAQNSVPSGMTMETDWSLLKLQGPLDFALTGVLSQILNPLAEAKISIFALSTYDTDYILIRSEKLTAAQSALKNAGFVVD